jgi:uncharacterized membrane protein YoaK (UPF0700 family)
LQSIAKGQERLAAILALIAGSLDAYGFMTYQTYLSFMSGNTTQTGSALGQGNWGLALPSGLAIAFFVCGCFAATLLTHSALRRTRRLVFVMVVATLASIIGITMLGILYAGLHIAAISFSMGLMNTAVSRVGAQSVNLTFVTGTLSRLGMHLALAVKQAPLSDSQGPWDTHWGRALALATIWTGFLTGAILAGAATPRFGVWVLLAPLLALSVLAARDQRARDDAGRREP